MVHNDALFSCKLVPPYWLSFKAYELVCVFFFLVKPRTFVGTLRGKCHPRNNQFYGAIYSRARAMVW